MSLNLFTVFLKNKPGHEILDQIGLPPWIKSRISRDLTYLSLELTLVHSEDVLPTRSKHLVILFKILLKMTFYNAKEKIYQ